MLRQASLRTAHNKHMLGRLKMPQYRVHKSNLTTRFPDSAGFNFVRVSSNADGVTLDRISYAQLPVVKHAGTGDLGRRATVITAIESDEKNPDWFVCTTQDVIVPYKEEGLICGPESKWKVV